MTSTHQIKSADIKPGDIIKFEYGDYNNWVTAVIDSVSIDPTPHTYYPLKLVWHYLSDEKRGAPEEAQESKPQRDCRAEKLGNNPALSEASAPAPYPQFTCYSSLDSLVEKLN